MATRLTNKTVAHPLQYYRRAPASIGLYMIGKARDPALPVTANGEYDPYVFNWPDNLDGLYVGNSHNRKSGVRGRLSCHARRRGNRDIAARLARGEALWFITATGEEAFELEALFLCLQNPTFLASNVRGENTRFARRLIAGIDADLARRGVVIPDLSGFDPEDFG